MEKWRQLLCIVPEPPKWQINWPKIENSRLSFWIEKMKAVRQNPLWHGEGDVWTHTMMVCEALVALPAYQSLNRKKQEELFLAALLHDVGKIPCTRLEDGIWKSPNHTAVGSRMAREILWLQYGFCGNAMLQQFRETICTLIRYHSVPPHILEQENPEYRLIRIASNGRLIPDFSIELLCLLVMADMTGRICADKEEAGETVELCRLQAIDSGCLQSAVDFPNDFSEYAYLTGRDIMPGQELYDDSWGEVILMAGLPGIGKDTWIEKCYRGYPVVSLDVLRKKWEHPQQMNRGRL